MKYKKLLAKMLTILGIVTVFSYGYLEAYAETMQTHENIQAENLISDEELQDFLNQNEATNQQAGVDSLSYKVITKEEVEFVKSIPGDEYKDLLSHYDSQENLRGLLKNGTKIEDVNLQHVKSGYKRVEASHKAVITAKAKQNNSNTQAPREDSLSSKDKAALIKFVDSYTWMNWGSFNYTRTKLEKECKDSCAALEREKLTLMQSVKIMNDFIANKDKIIAGQKKIIENMNISAVNPSSITTTNPVPKDNSIVISGSSSPLLSSTPTASKVRPTLPAPTGPIPPLPSTPAPPKETPIVQPTTSAVSVKEKEAIKVELKKSHTKVVKRHQAEESILVVKEDNATSSSAGNVKIDLKKLEPSIGISGIFISNEALSQ